MRHIKLALVLLLGFFLMLSPALRFSEPVVQTDGITYYVPAKLFGEHLTFDQENPKYNMEGTHVLSLRDYPPLTYITLGLALRVFGHDTIWLNGLYAACLLLVHLVFLYLLLLRIVKHEWWALFGTLLGALNIRLYFLAYTGMFPTLLSVCLTTPALFFLWEYFAKRDRVDLFAFIGTTFLVGLAYPQQMMLFAVMAICLTLAQYLEGKISWPQLNTKPSFSFVHDKWLLLAPLSAVLIAGYITVRYGLLVKTTASWAGAFIRALLYTHESGYPLVWKMPFLLDGPFVFLLGLFGCILLLLQKKWKLPTIFLGVSAVVLFGVLFIPDIWVRIYFFRFFVQLSILLGILATYALATMCKKKALRMETFILGSLILLIALGKLFAFFVIVQPAITPEEHDAALFVRSQSGPVYYVNNIEEYTTFRSFNWVITIAQHEEYTVGRDLESLPDDAHIIYIGDMNKVPPEQTAMLSTFAKYTFGDVAVFIR